MIDVVRAALLDVWSELRRPMTTGQRQSAMLLVPLTIALVLYGRPADSPLRPSLEAPLVQAPATPVAAGSGDGAPPEVPAPAVTPTRAAAPRTPDSEGTSGSGQPASVEPAAGPRPAAPTVVAMVRDDADADLAGAFLADLPHQVETIGLDASCDDVLAAGRVVLASLGLPEPLRTCLVEGGATVVAHDALGDLPPDVSGPGQVLSTRRGYADALVELAAWAVQAGAADGAVGLVAMESMRQHTEAVRPTLEGTGLELAAVTYLPDDDPALSVPRSVLELVAAGATTTVFATPARVQRDWVQQAAVVSPRMQYLVADAFDAVTATGFSAGFEGTPALTTLRFPWSDDPSPSRDACNQRWRDASGDDQLSASQRVRMYAWCQHVALVGSTGLSPAALRAATADSPITTELGPLSDGGWGPTRHVVVRWRQSCDCWRGDGTATARTTHGGSRP